MSDYSFMKSGFNTVSPSKNVLESFDMEFIMTMLDLFSVNASKNALRYITLCKRNTVTPTDIKYGLIYEIFEFMKNPNSSDLKEIKIEKNLKKTLISSDDENDENDKYIIDDNLAEPFKQRFENDIIDSFESNEDKEFVKKIHYYHDTFPEWQPQNRKETYFEVSYRKIFLNFLFIKTI